MSEARYYPSQYDCRYIIQDGQVWAQDDYSSNKPPVAKIGPDGRIVTWQGKVAGKIENGSVFPSDGTAYGFFGTPSRSCPAIVQSARLLKLWV